MKTILVDAINAFVLGGEGIFKEMHDLLEQYPNPKIIVTNANDEQMKEHGLDAMPYPVFTLKHEPEKTNPEYFRLLINHFLLSPEELIYFEHNKDAVESARSLGIIACHYDKDAKDLASLKEFLDRNK